MWRAEYYVPKKVLILLRFCIHRTWLTQWFISGGVLCRFISLQKHLINSIKLDFEISQANDTAQLTSPFPNKYFTHGFKSEVGKKNNRKQEWVSKVSKTYWRVILGKQRTCRCEFNGSSRGLLLWQPCSHYFSCWWLKPRTQWLLPIKEKRKCK